MRNACAKLLVIGAVCIGSGLTGPSALAGSISPAKARSGAPIGPSAKLSAAFDPKRLGAATTISFALSITATDGGAPPPLSNVDVSFPGDLGFATSGLGLAACDPTALEVEGPAACPPNSQMGRGSALSEVSFGPRVVPERVDLRLFAGPSLDGYLHLVILASGRTPVIAHVVLKAVLLPGHIEITVPPVPALPGGPDVVFTSLRATLGGALTYYRRSHGRSIPYRPQGIGLPDRCPRAGWRLASKLAFLDGQRSLAETVIPCPARRRR
ncbi:MAG: hypothetical protein H0X28_14565 [Solirubrobacterales bacterium]|nr:hypothetical protein [Solirubrobacterales bacterium]